MDVMTEILLLLYYTQFKYHYAQFSDGYDEKKNEWDSAEDIALREIGYDQIILAPNDHSGCTLIIPVVCLDMNTSYSPSSGSWFTALMYDLASSLLDYCSKFKAASALLWCHLFACACWPFIYNDTGRQKKCLRLFPSSLVLSFTPSSLPLPLPFFPHSARPNNGLKLSKSLF